MSQPSTIISLACTALPGPNARDHCRKCTATRGYLARYIKANGHVAIRWVCEWCEDYATAGDLPHTILGATTIDALPLRVDNSDHEWEPPPCAVCGQPAQEMHHWAPVAIFQDWPYELVIPLCTPHHREWHFRMRVCGLRWPHEIEEAA